MQKFIENIRKTRVSAVITVLLIAAICISSIVSYMTITSPDTLSFEPTLESNLLLLNLGLLLCLGLVVSRKLIHIYVARQKGKVGSRLLLRLVFISCIVSIVPSLVVGLSSSFYLNLAMKSWFDERVNKAVVESVAVANAYLEEHRQTIRADALAIATELNSSNIPIYYEQDSLNRFLNLQAGRRLLAEAIVFREDKGVHKIITGSRISFMLDPLSKVTENSIQIAALGEVAVLADNTEDKVSAIVNVGENTYLMVSRFVDPKVLEHTQQARGAADEYLKLKREIANFQVKSTVLFFFIAVFLLLSSIWMAFRFAGTLVSPITNLVSATDRVKRGEFTVRVKEGPENDEIGILTRSFNQMAAELDDQKHGLMRASLESKERAAFIETVLSGVSSGVMALDVDKSVVTLNRAAMEFLGLTKSAIGKNLKEAVPEFFEALQENITEGQIAVRRKQKRMNFLLRITPQLNRKTIDGYILTFDDITDLLSAQRYAAWSDVARRIAHEIKNPLTPINLSAQRIAKKFKAYVPADELENFEGYTNTITRHTADIAQIIGEFSNFAKMPAPKFSKTNISLLLKDAIFSARVSFPEITYELDMPDMMETIADPSQITQVLTNVIKNASESIMEKGKKDGRIMAIAQIGKEIEIYIDDNGPGFPEELLDRITEPYVTTRAKGTGLGLAIVKKIMEDHNGKLELTNNKGGARVKLVLPIV